MEYTVFCEGCRFHCRILFERDGLTIEVLRNLSLCENYEDIFQLQEIPELRIAEMTKGKANDDSREIHDCFQIYKFNIV